MLASGPDGQDLSVGRAVHQLPNSVMNAGNDLARGRPAPLLVRPNWMVFWTNHPYGAGSNPMNDAGTVLSREILEGTVRLRRISASS